MKPGSKSRLKRQIRDAQQAAAVAEYQAHATWKLIRSIGKCPAVMPFLAARGAEEQGPGSQALWQAYFALEALAEDDRELRAAALSLLADRGYGRPGTVDAAAATIRALS